MISMSPHFCLFENQMQIAKRMALCFICIFVAYDFSISYYLRKHKFVRNGFMFK